MHKLKITIDKTLRLLGINLANISINADETVDIFYGLDQKIELSNNEVKNKLNEEISAYGKTIGICVQLFAGSPQADFEEYFSGAFANAMSWADLMDNSYSLGSENPTSSVTELEEKIVSFYSFKGGVGRTTALTNAALVLASRGKRVVVFDLDVEAPGLYSTFEFEEELKFGIIDYLHGKAIGSLNNHSITEYFYQAITDGVAGEIFVFPAGKINEKYIQMVSDLTPHNLVAEWHSLLYEANKQLAPDYILIDSRTGINHWGSLSVLNSYGRIVFLMFPNEQNAVGSTPIIKHIVSSIKKEALIAFSPVPSFNSEGKSKAEKLFELLASNVGMSGDAEPLMIHYDPSISLMDRYTEPPSTPAYTLIANFIESGLTMNTQTSVLSEDRRWEILESLSYPKVDATSNEDNLFQYFHKTNYFDRFIEHSISVIRGRKGTGKTSFYRMFTERPDTAKKLAEGKIDNVTIVSGHGSTIPSPKDELLEKFSVLDWRTFWKAYAVLNIFRSTSSLSAFSKVNFRSLKKILQKITGFNTWTRQANLELISLINSEDSLLLNELLQEINSDLTKAGKFLWLVYDDLDQDFQNEIRKPALIGLFKMLQHLDSFKDCRIKLKILIREDIWQSINFDNKSHLKGRDILIEWKRADFIRLALKFTSKSSKYRDIMPFPLDIENLEDVSEDDIQRAMVPLWGESREGKVNSKLVTRWVFERLTDSSGTSFPRSLIVLLKSSTDHELTYRNQSVQSPKDRLLRRESLNRGLDAAAEQRCQEILEEYPQLEPVFKALKGFPGSLAEPEFFRSFKESLPRKFDPVITAKDLEEIGVLQVIRAKEKVAIYRFPDLYVIGFNMDRQTRRY